MVEQNEKKEETKEEVKKEVVEEPKDKRFSATIEKADIKTFKSIIKTEDELLSEATFLIKKDGIKIQAMDPTNVAMVLFNIKSGFFSEYKFETDMSVALNVKDFKDIFKRISKGQVVLEFGDNIKVINKATHKKTFKLPIIDEDNVPTKVPELEFKTEVVMETSEFVDMIADSKVVAESLKFLVKDKKLLSKAESDSAIGLLSSYGEGIEVKGEDAESKYSNDYLKKMTFKDSKDMKIEFNSDYPLRLTYKLENVDLVFVLAPRVESD